MSRWWVIASCISTGRMDQWDEDEEEGIIAGGCVVVGKGESGEDLYMYVHNLWGRSDDGQTD